jgi:hypothetical protein
VAAFASGFHRTSVLSIQHSKVLSLMKKAVLVQEFIYEGMMDFVHGGRASEYTFLVIPEANNLAV